MNRLHFSVEQIKLARGYTCHLLETIDRDDWFRMPPGGVTHIGWQVGHLAMAQYRLCLERLRGARPEDKNLISESFLTWFGRGSRPEDGPSVYPPAQEIRRIFDAVHEQVLKEVSGLSESLLDEPPLVPHPQFNSKLGALCWTSRHEMIHAGQIGLIRRQLGAEPVR